MANRRMRRYMRRSGNFKRRVKRAFVRRKTWTRYVPIVLVIAVLGLIAYATFSKNPPKWIPGFLLKLRKDRNALQGEPSLVKPDVSATVATKI